FVITHDRAIRIGDHCNLIAPHHAVRAGSVLWTLVEIGDATVHWFGCSHHFPARYDQQGIKDRSCLAAPSDTQGHRSASRWQFCVRLARFATREVPGTQYPAPVVE